MAAGLMRKTAGDVVTVDSAGTKLGGAINGLSAQVLLEVGVDSVRQIVIERSCPLRDLLVGPAFLCDELQVVGPTALLGELALLEPIPAFTTNCCIVHSRGLATLFAVEEADEGHAQKLPAPWACAIDPVPTSSSKAFRVATSADADAIDGNENCFSRGLRPRHRLHQTPAGSSRRVPDNRVSQD